MVEWGYVRNNQGVTIRIHFFRVEKPIKNKHLFILCLNHNPEEFGTDKLSETREFSQRK